MKEIRTTSMGTTERELELQRELVHALQHTPIPDDELLDNVGLYLRRQNVARMLFMHDLYLRIISVHGVVAEFGTRWGQNLALFSTFRSIYEPYNYNRKVIGFDTFSGFPSTHSKDGKRTRNTNYGVTEGYEKILKKILQLHEDNAPLSHIQKFEVVKGDATKTVPKYLKEHPETIVALAYIDFDLYTPTKKCLSLLERHLTKGSVVAFDQLNCDVFPGETEALRETLGLARYAIRRSPLNPLCSYIIIE